MKKQLLILSLGALLLGAANTPIEAMSNVLYQAPTPLPVTQLLQSERAGATTSEAPFPYYQTVLDYEKTVPGKVISVPKDVHMAEVPYAAKWQQLYMTTNTSGTHAEYRMHEFGDDFLRNVWGRIDFYVKAHNWSDGTRRMGDETLPPSYGYTVLHQFGEAIEAEVHNLFNQKRPVTEKEVMQSLTNVLAKQEAATQNDELKFYMNEILYFATKQVLGTYNSIQ